MKRKYVPIIGFSLAILLMGSIAYASDKRKKVKLVVQEPSEMSEEAFKSELLNTSDVKHKKQSATKVATNVKFAEVDLAELQVK